MTINVLGLPLSITNPAIREYPQHEVSTITRCGIPRTNVRRRSFTTPRHYLYREPGPTVIWQFCQFRLRVWNENAN